MARASNVLISNNEILNSSKIRDIDKVACIKTTPAEQIAKGDFLVFAATGKVAKAVVASGGDELFGLALTASMDATCAQTIDIATKCVFKSKIVQPVPVVCTFEAANTVDTSIAHGLLNGTRVVFLTDGLTGGGTLASLAGATVGVSAGVIYYVINKAADTFEISLTQGGPAVTFANDDAPTCYFQQLLDLTPATTFRIYHDPSETAAEWQFTTALSTITARSDAGVWLMSPGFKEYTAVTCTFPGHATEVVTATAHGLSDGTPIRFLTDKVAGVLPVGLSAGIIYYMRTVTTDTFQVALTPGGTAVTFADAGTDLMYFVRCDGTRPLEYISCTLADTGDLVTTTVAHKLKNGDNVRFITDGVAGRMAAGGSTGVVYFVISATTYTFQIALTSGGAAVVLSGNSVATMYLAKVESLTANLLFNLDWLVRDIIENSGTPLQRDIVTTT